MLVYRVSIAVAYPLLPGLVWVSAGQRNDFLRLVYRGDRSRRDEYLGTAPFQTMQGILPLP